jgi:hypothetical protein
VTHTGLIAPLTLAAEAAALDRQLRAQWGQWKRQARVIGSLFKKMMDKQLHRYVRKPGSKKGYQRFDEYVADVTGGMANSTVWVMMRIHGLTEGTNALLPNEVDEMPQQNAYELTKLKPEQRTPEVVRKAIDTPTKKFKAEVQKIRNADLPPEKQKPVLVDIHEQWPVDLVEMFEETVSDFSCLAVVRDGHRDIAIRHKAITTILTCARLYAGDEIRVAKAELDNALPIIPDVQGTVKDFEK